MLLTCAAPLIVCGHALAQDLSVALSEAESRAEAARSEVDALEAAVAPRERRFGASDKRAAPVEKAARTARRRMTAIESELRAKRLAAAGEISRIEEEKRNASDEHAEKVQSGVGLALAALTVAIIALAWGWFRASALVALLARLPLGQAIGLCIGGGFLVAIVGAAMVGAGGIAGAVGTALVFLGILLAIALLLARHSAEVQRQRSKPMLGHERLPRWVAQTTAGAMFILCLLGLGTAIFAGEAKSDAVSAALRREATETNPSPPALVKAEREAAELGRRASSLSAVASADLRDLRSARRQLGHAEARLASAEGDAASFSHRLAVLSAREEREAQAEARRAEEKAEELAAEECNPNYSGCLDPSASDYDCEGGSGDGPLYTGTVEVLGYDEYGLDSDGDGIGCES